MLVLGDHIEYAYHALAIDEKRRPFAPNLWTQVDIRNDRSSITKDVCQVWFPGVHSDIGGGNKDGRLSEEALIWMVNRAGDCGLAFDSKLLPKEEVGQVRFAGELKESFTFVYKPLWLLGMPPYKRPIGCLEHPNPIQRIPADSWVWKPLKWLGVTRYEPGLKEMIHESAQKRLDADPISYLPHHYGPKNLMSALTRMPVFHEAQYKKRRHSRHEMKWIAHITNGKKTGMCTILDFSSDGGACINDIENIVQISSNRTLSLIMPGESGVKQVHPVWRKDQKVGLQFIQISEQPSSIYPRVA